MVRNKKSSLVLSSALALASLTSLTPLASLASLAGCLAEEGGASGGDRATTGRVEVPLTRVADDGTIYRLQGVRLALSGSGGARIVEADDGAATLSFEAEAGVLSAKLLDGWSLEQSGDGGATFSAVGAVLASLNPMVLAISPNSYATLSFEFLLRNPSGTVDVRFFVEQVSGQINALVFPREATGRLAPYRFSQLGMALYYKGSSYHLPSPDGPALVTWSWTTGLEIYDDRLGLLSEELAPRMSGYALHFEVAAREDGTQLLSGDFTNNHQPDDPALSFSGSELWQPLPLNETGYPVPGPLLGQVPFSISLADEEGSTMSGVMNLQSLPASYLPGSSASRAELGAVLGSEIAPELGAANGS